MNRSLVVAAVVLVLSGIWILPVSDPSEARYAEVAREMAVGGDWLVPQVLGQPHLSKPPLTYWLAAVAIRLFGPQAWAARLPSAFAFILTVIITADLGKRLWSGSRSAASGASAGWALLLSVVPLAAANILTTDPILALFETVCVWCGWRSVTASGRSERTCWGIGFHAALALAFLTKGPPGLLSAAALAAFLVRHRRAYDVRGLVHPIGFLVFAVLAVPWFAAVADRVPGALSYWWGTETVQRFVGDSGRSMPFYVYFPVLFGGCLPAGIFLPAAARWLSRQLRGRGPDAAPAELLLWWVGLPLVVLCIARSRLPFYVLPLFAPLAILIGRYVASHWTLQWREDPHLRRARLGVAGALAVMGIALKLGLVHVPGILKQDPRPAAAAIVADAEASGRRPEVFITSRHGRLPAFGLAFYARQELHLFVFSRENEPVHGVGSQPPEVDRLLETPPPADTMRYVVVRADQAEILDRKTRGRVRGDWIYRSEGLWIWRRASGVPTVAAGIGS